MSITDISASLRNAAGLILIGTVLLVSSSLVVAQQTEQPVFCGGLVTVRNDNPLLLGTRTRLDGTKDIARQTVDVESVKGACPVAAPTVTIQNGIGAVGDQPALPVADAFDPTGTRTLYQRIPDGSVQTYGVLGQELQGIFRWRASIQLRSDNMQASLLEVRRFTGAFTNSLRQKYDQYRATMPALKTRLSNDVAGQQNKLNTRSAVDAHDAAMARQRLRDLTDGGSLSVPVGAIGGLAPLLQSRARSAQIESQIPPYSLRPPNLGTRSILGALDSYRWSQYSAGTAAGRDIQFEKSKLEDDTLRAGGGADDRARKSYERARESLALAQEFSASGSPAAAEITTALMEQARSYRYAADGRARQAQVASRTAAGATEWQAIDPDSPLPSTSIVENARAYSNAKAAYSVYESSVHKELASRSLTEQVDGDALLYYADSLTTRAEADYRAGNIAEAQKLLDHGSDVIEHVQQHEIGWDATLNAENKKELDEFDKSVTSANADAWVGKFADFMGDSYLNIKDFGAVASTLGDFGLFGVAVTKQAMNPSDENYAKCAELGLKFAVGVNYAGVGILIATGIGLTPVGVFGLAIALGVAADYSTRALIASPAYTGPRVKKGK